MTTNSILLISIFVRPVTIRPRSPSLVYASLLIHGLFFVPQIRERVAKWRPREEVSPIEMQGAGGFGNAGGS
jgi:hypothetical protein